MVDPVSLAAISVGVISALRGSGSSPSGPILVISSTNALPTVPSGFLPLTGISSAAYLGGRIARKPGPIIDQITATRGSVLIEIVGRKLSKDATFQIDGVEVNRTGTTLTAADPDDSANPAEFYKKPSVHAPESGAGPPGGGRHKCKIIDPDGQRAEWFFAWPATPVISGVKALISGAKHAKKLTLDLTGTQLANDAKFKIDDKDVLPEHQPSITAGDAEEALDQPRLFKRLTLKISELFSEWQTANMPHRVSIINSPTETAEASWTVAPAQTSRTTPSPANPTTNPPPPDSMASPTQS
jgi:hypothetical protein